MLSNEKFTKARHYIMTHARPLDRALFEFEFMDKSPRTVLDILKTYQNEDGGFGQALESDFRTDKSSVLATTVAMQYVHELKLSEPNDMIKQAILYLIREIQEFPKGSPLNYFWNLTPFESNHSLHAPWWSGKKLEPPRIEEWPNPSVEVIGYLLRYQQFISQSLYDEIVGDLQKYLKFVPKLTEFIYYKFLCFKRLIHHVSQELSEDIITMLDTTFENLELLDEQKFEEIKIQRLITEKTSYLYQKHPKKMKQLIENEVKRLGDDGGSHPLWKWGEDEIWKQVEREWTGKCTYELLVTLKYCDLLHIGS